MKLTPLTVSDNVGHSPNTPGNGFPLNKSAMIVLLSWEAQIPEVLAPNAHGSPLYTS
jgi:hypothetical protein